jgi:hypothetical protein
MTWLSLAILLGTGYPLGLAVRSTRRTSLAASVGWAAAAWAAWVLALGVTAVADERPTRPLRYLALALTGCAGVAVLGARRPGVGAWNFVVAGLLAVLLLPLAEAVARGTAGELHLTSLQMVFLGATLGVPLLNYLPTRLAPAVLLLGLGCAAEVLGLALVEPARLRVEPAVAAGRVALALSGWAAWVGWRRRPRPASEFDRLWLTFRDQFGLVWGQRLRDQFNRAAANAGWPVVLRWRGLRLLPGTAPLPESVQAEVLGTLRAALKRFGPATADEPAGQ